MVLVAARSDAQNCLSELASRSTNGGWPDGNSLRGQVSDDGFLVCFISDANNLVTGDSNGVFDVFVFDRRTLATSRVSVATNGTQGNGSSIDAHMSADGSFIVFTSASTNLAPGLPVGSRHVFLHTRATGELEVVSRNSSGELADDWCNVPRVSRDGRYVVFESTATNLAPGGTLSGVDCYLRDRWTGETRRISSTPTGEPGEDLSFRPVLSSDGRVVAFLSKAGNLTSTTILSSSTQLYSYDLASGTITLESVSTTGGIASSSINYPSLSADGRRLAFETSANNLVVGATDGNMSVFVRDRFSATTQRVTSNYASGPPGGITSGSEISGDGEHVILESTSPNLVAGDLNGQRDVFVIHITTGASVRISLTSTCGELSTSSDIGGLSYDGRIASFISAHPDVIPGDTANRSDLFIRSLEPQLNTYCTAKINSLGCLPEVTTSGFATSSGADEFYLHATQIRSNVSGLLFYGVNGPSVIPVGGGVLCMAGPRKRTAVQSSGPAATPANCAGQFVFEFNVLIQSGLDPSLGAGQTVWAQFWGRDPGFAPPFNVTLTNAAQFTIH